MNNATKNVFIDGGTSITAGHYAAAMKRSNEAVISPAKPLFDGAQAIAKFTVDRKQALLNSIQFAFQRLLLFKQTFSLLVKRADFHFVWKFK